MCFSGPCTGGVKKQLFAASGCAFLCPWLPPCPILQVREWFCVVPRAVGAVLPGLSTQGKHGRDLQAGSEGPQVPASPRCSRGIKHLQ